MIKTSLTYKILRFFGLKLSLSQYGSASLLYIIFTALRLWKNEFLNKLSRSSVIFCPAPLNVRMIRPFLQRMRGVNIGKNCGIGPEVIFDGRYPEKIFIGDGCQITMGAQIICHKRDFSNYDQTKKISELGYIVADVIIEDEVAIGAGSIINPGVVLGRGCIIAAGAVVTKDVEPFTMVAGIPAKKIKDFKK